MLSIRSMPSPINPKQYLADLVQHEAPLPDEVHDVQLEHVPLAAALPLLRVVHQLRDPPPEVVVAGLSATVLKQLMWSRP